MVQVPRLLADITIPQITGPGVSPGGNGTSALETIISQVIGVMTIFAVVFFAFQIIIAGYMFLNSQGEEKNMENARRRLTEGVLGLTIVIVAVGLGALIATLAGIPNILDLNAMFTKMGL